jgi:hypothetical protein
MTDLRGHNETVTFKHNFHSLDRTKSELAARLPGWQIWYVPQFIGGVKWCARPWPLINSASPEQLEADIRQAHEEAPTEWLALANKADYEISAPAIKRAEEF